MAGAAKDRDFIVVGSGAAGLVGAIAAHLNGLRPIIIEKAAFWGGTTALSGGVIWAPDNMLMHAAGEVDSPQEAHDYVMRLLGDDASPRQIAKARRYLATVNDMLAMLAAKGVRWHRNAIHPDYYPTVEGARVGRTLEPALFDGKRTGPWLASLRAAATKRPVFYTSEMPALVRAKTGVRPFAVGAWVMIRNWLWRATGRQPLSLGRALVAALLELALKLGIPILLETKLIDVEVSDGRVSGVVVEGTEGRRSLPAPAGVLLAAGGFARNGAMRRQYQGDLDGSWSNASEDDQGDALAAAIQIGADAEFLDSAWWQPTVMMAPDQPSLTLGERALPGSIIVDERGRRYFDEAQSYMRGGATMREHGAARNPHWLIFDQQLLNRYIFRALSLKTARESMRRHGYMKTADNIAALAEACGLDSAALVDTVSRFNGYAKEGVDLEFGRGSTDYDRYWGDPAHKPNPALGAIDRPPFHAVRIFPGDIGTNGGIMTDENARVLATGGEVIEGLYAAGNASSSPFVRSYPGGGATVGAAMTFGYIAALDAAAKSRPYREGPDREPT